MSAENLTRSADLFGWKAAIQDGERVVSYRNFETRANRLDHALLGLEPKPQAVIAVMAHSSAELLITYFVCVKAGLIAHCRSYLASFKAPKAVVFVDAFPCTGTSKVQKHVMRSQMQGRYAEDNGYPRR